MGLSTVDGGGPARPGPEGGKGLGWSKRGSGPKGWVLAVLLLGLLVACEAPARPASIPTVEKTFPTPPPVQAVASATPAVAPKTGGAPAGAAAAASEEKPKGDASKGKAVFQARCTACHPNGQAGVGPSLVGFIARGGEGDLAQRVRAGKGIMPAFTPAQVSDADLADLAAFLATLK
ncbi:MAG: cytochrome c [Actinobacteria bacterium]|nr:cytochrome c [Actinomycetota bacterium]MCL5025508.1 cytochrome c [Chloroflexota bacterium]